MFVILGFILWTFAGCFKRDPRPAIDPAVREANHRKLNSLIMLDLAE